MSEGRLLVIGACIKQGNQFRARNIVESTGMSRQLVNHHLKLLVDEGLLSKQDVFYLIPNSAELVQEMIDVRLDKSSSTTIDDGALLLDTDQVQRLNNRIQVYLSLKSLKYPHLDSLRTSAVSSIKEAIGTLENGKKYINNAQFSEASARKRLLKSGGEVIWKNLKTYLEMSEDEFGIWWDEHVTIGD